MARQPADAPKTPLPGKPVRGSSSGKPVMALLDLLGRRGVLRILWELRGGPLNFRALEAAAEQNPSTLNARLKDLRAAALIDLGEDGYALTDLGSELLPAATGLTQWAEKWARAVRS